MTPRTPADELETTALLQGFRACRDGIPREANPHESGTIPRGAWDSGWLCREAEEREP